MTKTDWTAEEVRALLLKIAGGPISVTQRVELFDIASRFAERIEADESAVPVLQILPFAEVDWLQGGPCQLAPGTKLFTHPPAQPAQEQPGWKVPEGLVERVKEAEKRIQNNQSPRRIPADPTDVDLVLAEVRLFLTGEAPPFWIASPTPPKEK